MITLFQYPAMFGLPNASPFCMKLETYLRMSSEPFQVKSMLDPRKAPKGKLPFIKDGDTVVADSSAIIDYLNRTRGRSLDDHLTGHDRAVALAAQRLIEESLYFVSVYQRWVDDRNWPVTKAEFFKSMPAPLRLFVPELLRRTARKTVELQGTGRHAPEEIEAIGIRNVGALSDLLEDRPYFFGDAPCSLDASAYGMLAQFLWTPVKGGVKAEVEKRDNLVAFCERIRDRYYGSD